MSKANSRDKILNAAEHLMLREGFHGVSVERIIADAGISKGTFFYHFPSKEALPAALLRRFIEDQGAALNELFRKAEQLPAPLERVLAVLDGLAPVFTRPLNGGPGCFIAAFSYQMTGCSELCQISQDALQGWREGFGEFVAPLCAAHPAAPSPAELSDFLMNCLQGASIMARIYSDPNHVALQVEQFRRYLLCLFHSPAGSA